jgi:hypothetical protein
MANEDHGSASRPPRTISRRAWMPAALIGVLVAVIAVLAVTRHADPGTTASPSTPAPASTAAVTTTTVGEREEVVTQLRAILRTRDRAYLQRDTDLLREVYTTDCPCLRGDKGAIQQLLKDNVVWVGANTSVQVRKLERVNDRLWIVVANFVASPFRIETESGELIRAVGGRSELFRFALRRTTSNKFLLGFAGPVDESD